VACLACAERSASVSKQLLWYELRLSNPVRSSETPMRRTRRAQGRVWLTLISIWSPMACKKVGFVRASTYKLRRVRLISIPAGICVFFVAEG